MIPERCYDPAESGPLVTISRADYLRLLEIAWSDDTIIRCQRCGAWLDHDDVARVPADDYDGCAKATTGSGPCRSYRVSEIG